jgi:hypothetical protein
LRRQSSKTWVIRDGSAQLRKKILALALATHTRTRSDSLHLYLGYI